MCTNNAFNELNMSASLGTMCAVDIRFELLGGICWGERGRDRERWAHRGAVHMMAAIAGCRKSLVSTDWATSFLLCTNGLRNLPTQFVEVPFPKILVWISIH